VPDSREQVADIPEQGAPGFLEGFENEPALAPVPAAPQAPPWPSSTSLTQDSYGNFVSLSNDHNVAHGYGATGLMCVVEFQSAHYGAVQPGTIFLFPGTYRLSPPAYVGTPRLNGAAHPPLDAASGVPLHKQMCDLLEQPTQNFIGFAANYPLAEATTGYNSRTCNEFWFDTRTLPLDWQQFVYGALEQAISVADADQEGLADEPATASTPTPTPTPTHLNGRNTTTMSSVQARPVSNGVSTDEDRSEFARNAVPNGHLAAAAETEYDITVNMSDDTVIKLLDGGFKLYAFKAVQSSQGGGMPTVWFTSDTFSGQTVVTWAEKYQAYTSRSQIVPGGKIDSSRSYPIDFGQTLEVGPGGTGTVMGQVEPKQPIFVENTMTTQFTCGISQLHDDKYTPLCALPLYGLNTVTVRPIEKVLLMFATNQVNTGTVIEQSFSSGALIDLTTDVSREVTYEINNGWGPSRASWLTLVPSRTALDELLIVPPSAGLAARWLSQEALSAAPSFAATRRVDRPSQLAGN